MRVRTELIWKKGKKSPTLKFVDRAAKNAGKSPQSFDRGFRGGKVARSKVTGGSSSVYVANGQNETIRIYRSGMIRKTAHKITFDSFDKDTGSYIQKCHAYVCADIAGQLHRQHCYRVRFNRDRRHPMIEELVEELPCASVEPKDIGSHAT